MPDPSRMPVRWYADRQVSRDPSDVLVPVNRSDAEPLDLIGSTGGRFGATHYVVRHDDPGSRDNPPLTVAAYRHFEVIDRRDSIPAGVETVVIPILRLSAADWATAATPPRGEFPLNAVPIPTVTDLHSGVRWIVSGWSHIFGPGPALQADPVADYEVRLPPEWGSARHESTYAVLDALAKSVPPFARWTIAGHYREAPQ